MVFASDESQQDKDESMLDIDESQQWFKIENKMRGIVADMLLNMDNKVEDTRNE